MPKQEYSEFVEKFKPKLTTDDCYTPDPVYEEVVRWCESEYGVELTVIRGESVRVSSLDNDSGSGIFGGGFLISERAAAERAAAERAAAERISLSPREVEIVRSLGA